MIALPAFAQQEILVQNFKVSPENYPAPNERQMKSLLEGTTGRAEPGGIYLVTGARLRTFEPSGKPDLEINVADEQDDDRIDEALKYYYDFHFDGAEQCLGGPEGHAGLQDVIGCE